MPKYFVTTTQSQSTIEAEDVRSAKAIVVGSVTALPSYKKGYTHTWTRINRNHVLHVFNTKGKWVSTYQFTKLLEEKRNG